MKDRKPYDLKRVIQAYNLMQVCASAYLVYEVSQNYLRTAQTDARTYALISGVSKPSQALIYLFFTFRV